MLIYSDAVLSQTSPTPLNAATASEFDRVKRFSYERTSLTRSIVHIGVGGFHRAHLATYVDELCEQGSTAWAIVGAGLLPSDQAMADALLPQDGLYCLVSRGANETDVSVIGSIVDFVMAADDPAPLIELIAAATTQIVSLTITEGGYPIDDRTGAFRPEECPANSAFGVIAAALEARRQSHGAPITILSCDNIMTNGEVARAATVGAAAAFHGDELIAWIDANVRFPNSMVDRITPVTAPADIAWLEDEHGISDRWPVVAEPFRQWVVEDNFAGERLPLESLDVIITDNIEPYELTKLRLLNAGHSCLAYLASLDGFNHVHNAMADPVLRDFVNTLLHTEAKPTLPAAAGINLDDYIASLLERFSNPQIGDQISRLCLDGSAKFPKFLLPSIDAQVSAGRSVALSALALAGWCEYLVQNGSNASPDPLLDIAVGHAQRSVNDPAAFLAFDEVFGTAPDEAFQDTFVAALTSLRASGVQSAVAAVLQEASPHHGQHRD